MKLDLRVDREALRLREPFQIAGYIFEALPGIRVCLDDGETVGRGEASGVYYTGDDVEHMLAAVEAVRPAIEAGVNRVALQSLLPAGGARNALDCALWELESRRAGVPVHRLAGLSATRPQLTTFTLPVAAPEELKRRLASQAYAPARALKLKLAGDLAADTARVLAVRGSRPDAWLGVDANQGYGREDVEPLAAMLAEAGVSLLEQPLPRGRESELDNFRSPVPLAADESILDLAEFRDRHRFFDVINIKLDKCGGLTEALLIADAARAAGKGTMVGNMAGSTLAAAPGFVLAQQCDFVDLDGPFFLADDPRASTIYKDGMVYVPDDYWGFGATVTDAGSGNDH